MSFALILVLLLCRAAYGAQEQQSGEDDPFRKPPSETPVEFPEPPSPAHGPEAVSIKHLGHKPPKPAVKQLNLGLRAKRNGQNDRAAQHLQEAIRLDPNYWEAHANLADVYWRENRSAQALEELKLALTIDPNSETLQANSAIALLALGRPAEAASAARLALKISPDSLEARYLLGMALLKSGQFTEETEINLAMAAAQYPQAKEAQALVEEYLKALSPKP